MLSYIKQYAEKIDGVHLYAFFSLLIFFLFFVVLLVLVKKMKKDKIIELSNIPFDNDEQTNLNL